MFKDKLQFQYLRVIINDNFKDKFNVIEYGYC